MKSCCQITFMCSVLWLPYYRQQRRTFLLKETALDSFTLIKDFKLHRRIRTRSSMTFTWSSVSEEVCTAPIIKSQYVVVHNSLRQEGYVFAVYLSACMFAVSKRTAGHSDGEFTGSSGRQQDLQHHYAEHRPPRVSAEPPPLHSTDPVCSHTYIQLQPLNQVCRRLWWISSTTIIRQFTRVK